MHCVEFYPSALLWLAFFAANLAIIERHWKAKKRELERRKSVLGGMNIQAKELTARVATANKKLKERLRGLQTTFEVCMRSTHELSLLRPGCRRHGSIRVCVLVTERALLPARQAMGKRDISDLLDLTVGDPWMVTIMHALCVLQEVDAEERALPDDPYVKVRLVDRDSHYRFFGMGGRRG